MKWSNQLENRILILGTAIVMTVAFMFFLNLFIRPVYETQIKGLTRQVEINNQLIERLANDPKYSIQNDFGKTKAKDGTVNLNLDNAMQVQDNNATKVNKQDTIKVEPVKEKKKLWDRLFRRKK